jgi:predicted AAA+ superfamily ATPase
LWEHGGFPEPFLKRDPRFSRRWQSLRSQQLLREDVRDLTQIQQLDQLALLVKLLDARSGHQVIYSNLARDIQVGVETVKRWCEMLGNLHHGFLLKPWFTNISRSLRKEPKWFLRDWAHISDPGDRAETFVACHLLKAVEGWTDLGYGTFQLGYLRDKEKREVDFIVIRDGKPWFLAEVKLSQQPVSESLHHFQKQTKAPYAFQIAIESEFVDADCFAKPCGPLAVPARTFLSQLL